VTDDARIQPEQGRFDGIVRHVTSKLNLTHRRMQIKSLPVIMSGAKQASNRFGEAAFDCTHLIPLSECAR
jgi:hypothetical protein